MMRAHRDLEVNEPSESLLDVRVAIAFEAQDNERRAWLEQRCREEFRGEQSGSNYPKDRKDKQRATYFANRARRAELRAAIIGGGSCL